MLGHQRHERLAAVGPGLQVLGVAEAQRRAEQDRALDGRVVAVHQRQVGAERPAQQPAGAAGRGTRRTRSPPRRRTARHRASSNAPSLVPARRRRAAGVEPQHGDVGQGGQPVGRLAEDVAVHEAAVRGQRVQASPAWRPGRGPAAARARRRGSARPRCAARCPRGGPAGRCRTAPPPGRACLSAPVGHRCSRSSLPGSSRWSSGAGGPAGGVPVPALVQPTDAVGRPDHDMRSRRVARPAEQPGHR